MALLAALAGGWNSADAQVEARIRSEAPRRTAELPEFLRVYDVNGDGVLSEEERQVARDVRDERLDSLTSPWDSNGDGALSLEEIQIAHSELEARIEEKRSARFDEADRDGDGAISDEEFRSIPAISRLDPDKISAALEKLDRNGDGNVSKEEFLSALREARPRPNPRRKEVSSPRPVPTDSPR